MKIPNKNRKRGASILLMSFMFMIVLFLMASAMYKLIPAETHAANRSHMDLTAHHVANAGLKHTVAFLIDSMDRFDKGQAMGSKTGSEVLPDHSPTNAITDMPNLREFETMANANPEVTDPRWRYEIAITPDESTINKLNSIPKVFQVRSTAFFNDKPIRSVDVWLRQSSFASFAFFTSEFDGQFRVDGDLGFAGPVHTNEYFVFNVLSPDQYDPTKSEPYFGDSVTFSDYYTDSAANGNGDGNEWVQNAPYDATGVTAGAYDQLFSGGRNSLQNKDSIQLPDNTSGLSDLAFEGEGTASIAKPTTKGVYVYDHDSNGKVDSGIYIAGDHDSLFLGLDDVGNQVITLKDWEKTADINTTTKDVFSWVSYNPKRYYNKAIKYCPGGYKWKKVAVPGGSTGGVAAGGGGQQYKNVKYCPGGEQTKYEKRESKKKVKTGETTSTSDDYDEVRRVVIEAESAVAKVSLFGNDIIDPDTGTTISLSEGETFVATLARDDEGTNKWEVATGTTVQKTDGLPNGTIYIEGSITGHKDGWEGMSGISKGTPQVDENGDVVKDATSGKVQYNSKIIATSLDDSIALNGDLLQFDPDKFATYGNKGAFDNQYMSTNVYENVALDPTRKTNGEPDPELSTSPDHTMGIVTKDVWMRARKKSDNRNGKDNYNDIYAVILAGKTNAGAVEGGFGTATDQVNSNKGGSNMGRFRIMGGVIQGTTDGHYWVNNAGNKGYDVSMFFDRVATYKRIFPTYPDFEVIRYLETSARR